MILMIIGLSIISKTYSERLTNLIHQIPNLKKLSLLKKNGLIAYQSQISFFFLTIFIKSFIV